MSRTRKFIAAAFTLAALSGGVAAVVAPAAASSTVASAPAVWYHG